MRWKASGRTCNKKRRLDSSAATVMTLLPIAVPIVLPAEGDFAVLDGDEAIVGNGDAVGNGGDGALGLGGGAEEKAVDERLVLAAMGSGSVKTT